MRPVVGWGGYVLERERESDGCGSVRDRLQQRQMSVSPFTESYFDSASCIRYSM